MTQQLTCWWCGAEPAEVIELQAFGTGALLRRAVGWPPADHRHAVTPPTPEELVADGHRILRRILEDA